MGPGKSYPTLGDTCPNTYIHKLMVNKSHIYILRNMRNIFTCKSEVYSKLSPTLSEQIISRIASLLIHLVYNRMRRFTNMSLFLGNKPN